MINNRLVIGNRNTGKTTFLLSEIDQSIKNRKSIIILDSATEHEDKSLLKKVINSYDKTVILETKEEKDIFLNCNNLTNYVSNYDRLYPYSKLLENQDKIICFDLSYFLEKGHEVYAKTKNINDYKYYRTLYNYLSQQIVLSLMLAKKNNEINTDIVFMDEIELPITNYDINNIQENITFIAAVHPENAFGTFYGKFNNEKVKTYVKERKK